MEPHNVNDQCHDLAARLLSLDPIEYDSVVNQYFESNCTFKSDIFDFHGASRIKKFLRLEAAITSKSHLVGRSHYNARDHVVTFAYQRTFHAPTLPTFVPLAGRLNNFLYSLQAQPVFDSELHLNAAQEETGETRLYVTKFGPTRHRDASFIEKNLPYFILRPFITLVAVLIADIFAFFTRHSLRRESPISIFFAAIAEFWGRLTGAPADPRNYPAPIKQAQDISEKLAGAVTGVLGSAQHTAHNVSSRAQGYSPVEQGQNILKLGLGIVGASINTASNITTQTFHTIGHIEQQSVNAVGNIASGAVNGAVNLATNIVTGVEHRAKDMGIPVDAYEDYAIKNAKNVAEWFGVVKQQADDRVQEAKARANEAKRGIRQTGEQQIATSESTLSKPLIQEHVPVPLAENHNPLALGAPAPAVPSAPTAPGAPSYAEVAQPHEQQ
ncbi:hypothetical protein CI109_107168 [Kwoniella shandongensis]|uniref:Uncharacterized protein n=1 Tax=Kwoniella shandongensis TaxID=1734106 RepID=A0A5M6C381_9TREE|nr:uncharacterized protein CI109_002451 [Kwoniella shandongensis]KAA5529110.1 hypothetical protein CI109_002451 [Kwoniella shandongensis]